MKQIKVQIAPDGTFNVEALGFRNASCQKATKPIEEALGTVQKTTNKPEAYIHESNPNQANQSNGW